MPVSPSSPGGPDILPPLERGGGGPKADVQDLSLEKADGAIVSRHRLRSSRSHSPQGARRGGNRRRSRDQDFRKDDRGRERKDRDGRRRRKSSRSRSTSYSPTGARRYGRSRSHSHSRSRNRSPPKGRHHLDRDIREFSRDKERNREHNGGSAPFPPRYGPSAGSGFPQDYLHRGVPPSMGHGGDPYGDNMGPYQGGGGVGLYGGPYRGSGGPYEPSPSGYHGGISNEGEGRVGPRERRGRGRRDEGPPGVSLLVRNVPPNVTTQDLQQAFGRIGEVRDIYIPRDFHSQQPKGFAFVEYAKSHQASEARDEMDRFLLRGRELEVIFAQENRKTPNEMRGRVVDGGVTQTRGETRKGGDGGSNRGGGGGGGESSRRNGDGGGRNGRNGGENSRRNGGGGGNNGRNGGEGGNGADFERSLSFERHKKREKEQKGQRP